MELSRSSDGSLIGRDFFQRDPVNCARELVGCELIWGVTISRIVETEAYAEAGDAACHTFFKPSARTFVQAHPAGTAYVYLNYGVHWMLNVLVKGEANGFVLIRALEPLVGMDLMAARRRLPIGTGLTSGPGKLTQALGIDQSHHGIDLCIRRKAFFRLGRKPVNVLATERIGINRAQELLWRFVAEGNPHVSGKKVRQG